jgi:hypothetical protein
MSWRDQLKGDPLPWLLEETAPGVRYLALRHLLDYPPDDRVLLEARKAALAQGPITTILAKMEEPGYWAEPGPGYRPKYKSTVWSVITLAQLGADVQMDERIERACSYVLENTFRDGGYFTMTGAPSGTIDCLQGNLCAALLDLGCEDARLNEAFEWMARSVTGEGVAPNTDRQAERRYYAGNCGPTFGCGGNNKLPCAWGGVKVMLALGKLPPDRRTELIEAAIEQGIEFLFSVDPAESDYPAGWSDKPSRNWWKFGFPVFYVTDLLQNAEALVRLGYGRDPRLARALALIRDKQDEQGRWMLEYDYTGKIWGDFGKKKQPNKWVTLRALQVLKMAA